jgi:DnaK suppressor protein
MIRQDGLVRLHKALLARRTELRKILAEELANLRDFKATGFTGDSADAAFGAESDEMSSQLAQLDARELVQIERALERMKMGTFGLCAGASQGCQKRIPVARLNALPYSTFCINCQRALDKCPDWQVPWRNGKWGQVFDSEALQADRRINVSAWERSLSGSRNG